MGIDTFFATHPVFTLSEFERYLATRGTGTVNNRKRLLAYHRKQGHIVSIRTGLYGAVPVGAPAETYAIDPYLIASRLTVDAVIGYHSALAFHGMAHSVIHQIEAVTERPLNRVFRYQGIEYKTIGPPKALLRDKKTAFGVIRAERQGIALRVTSLERTLVDLLDRPRLAGGWEEIWRSYGAVPYLDLDHVIAYAELLDNATVIAKLGYFLEANRKRWMIPERYLKKLQERRPRQPHYLDRQRREPSCLIKAWNLIVPEAIANRAWEETDEPIA